MKKKPFIFSKKLAKVALLSACILSLSFTAYASSIDEAKDERDQAQQNENDAKDVLQSLETSLNELVADVAALDNQISNLQSQITQKEREANVLQEQIDLTNIALADARVMEEQQYASMLVRIQYLYEEGDIGYLDTLMSSSSFTDMLNQSEYINQISEYDQEQLNALIATREDIELYESKLEDDMKEIQRVQADLETEKAALEDVIEEKNDQIAKFESDIVAQQALVDRFAADREAAEARIEELERALILAQQNSGQTIYDPSSYSGRFMWPATQGFYVSSDFGPRVSPTAGASSYHQGIDIPCPMGSDVVAAEDGTVVISQYSYSAGNYIMIDHGGGVSTVYMHNSQLMVGVGATVTKGQVIAKAGSTGYSTGPHCHFGVRINGSYVNPWPYLQG